MFMQNKYTRWYFSIIENAKKPRELGYFETHHIIPKCLDGSNTASNLVKLSAREHFICHVLLTKMHPNEKLKFACVLMGIENPYQKRDFKITSRMYDYLKKCNSSASRIRSTGVRHNLGRKVYFDPASNEERFFKPTDIIPPGFLPGRSPSSRKNMVGKNKGKLYCHNGEGKVKTIQSVEDLEEGWKLGNPNADTADKANLRGSKYFHDPKTGIEKRATECPPGWVPGRGVKWITNGTENSQVSVINETIPHGWREGRSKWRNK